MAAWVADALALLGLAVVTTAVVGVWRFPNVYTRVHAAAKAAVIGVQPLLAAAAVADPATLPKAILVAGFLLLTTPVGSHAVVRAAHLIGEPLEPQALDERD